MFYFFLGHSPDLSVLELEAVFGAKFARPSVGIAATVADLDQSKFPHLAGTRKVARLLTTIPRDQVESKLVELITAGTTKNIAVTDYANLGEFSPDLSHLKSIIRHTRPIRLVSMETNEHELVMLSHQHVTEYDLLPDRIDVNIAETSWIYDAEDWIRRDREKPYRDIKHGMLPPKIARLMVNLATYGKSGLKIADPFCGTGTVLAEALLTGCSAVGSDTSPEAVEGARANLSWLCDQYSIPPTSYSILEADATHIDKIISSADSIVTEPYMGPLLDERNPLPLEKIKNIVKGLDKLYRGAFKSWATVLPVGGRVVMTIPSFAVYNRVIETISIDTLTALGYNYIASVPYGKPGATVIRNITILEKV